MTAGLTGVVAPMDFGALPPEVNSGRMHSGPGSTPMLVAAATWRELAIELEAAAASYGSVVSGLTGGPWLGPAAMSMAAAATTYVAWMTATAAQCQQTATQAGAAAVAYEAALAMTVPPPVIAANRALLMALVGTNFVGQNTPAIMATETQYAQMWAQDAAAMYGYAAASAAASTLTPFTRPPPAANSTGLAAAVGVHTQATLSRLLSAVPQALASLGALPFLPTSILSTVSSFASAANSSMTNLSSGAAMTTAGPVSEAFGAVPSAEVGAGSPAVSAALGRAASVRTLSVPPSWAAVSPAASPGPVVLSGAGVGAAPAVAKDRPGSMLGVLPMGGMPTRGVEASTPEVRFRPTVVPRPPSGG